MMFDILRQSLLQAMDLEQALTEAAAVGATINMEEVVESYRQSWRPDFTMADAVRNQTWRYIQGASHDD